MIMWHTPEQEQERARRGLAPRKCYRSSLFGCIEFVDNSLYCKQCPWQSWHPGEWFPGKGRDDGHDQDK